VIENPSSAQQAYSNAIYDQGIVELSSAYDNTGGDDKDYYSDPGHSEEAIYACFESKRFRIISVNTVK